jgi:hypothetical protein
MHRELKACTAAAVLMIAAALTQPALGAREPGALAEDACPAVDLAGEVSLEGVQGTTFAGTYVGDLGAGSLVGSHPMRTFWQVDRVYAGGPLPEDLSFTTPECRWINLTPGVRYLFSTEATDIALDPDPAAGPRGEPAVTDSLAWELRNDGSVGLAPFDTYDVDDYGAEVRSVATFEEALAAVAPGAGDGTGPAAPASIDFGCTATQPNPTFENVQGTTFLGRYIGDEPLASGSNLFDTRVYWSVERVYAGAPLPEILTMRTGPCGPVTLRPGRRYVFTTADIHDPSISNSMAWLVRGDDRVRARPFRSIDMRFYRGSMPNVRRAMRQMETIDDVLAAVAPGAGEGEPPVRAADRTPG